MNIKYINKFIDKKYFDLPKALFKSALLSHKFKYLKSTLETTSPCIIICNKTCEYDEYLLRMTIKSDYVVLKHSIIEKIYSKTLSVVEKKELISNINSLKSAFISVVIFPEIQTTVLGRSQYLPLSITEFLYECNRNLRFINFIDSYYIKPIWSPKFRKANTYFNSKFNITHKLLSSMTPEERNYKINYCMPSSATAYGVKTHINILSNNLAHGFESVVFACPNCKEFFTLNAEYNHLKCNNCSIPFELTHSGMIYTNGRIMTFDELDIFLHDILNEKKFSKNKVADYDNVDFMVLLDDHIVHKIENVPMEIFTNKLNFASGDFKKTIYYKDVINYEYMPNNSLKLILKTSERFLIQSKDLKNLYIIYCLINKNI